MKIALLPITTFAFLTSSIAADISVPGSVSNVTFALSLTTSNPGTVAKDETGKPIKGEEAGPAYYNDWQISNETKKTEERTEEYVSKMKTVKFGNKELLQELVEREILPQYGTKAPYIAGWSIVVANATTTDEEGDSDQHSSSIYAVYKDKTTSEIVDLSNYIDFGYGSDYAENGTYKKVVKSTGVGTEDEASTTTITSAFNWKETNYCEIDFEGFDSGPVVTTIEGGFDITGISTLGNKLTSVGTGEAKVPVIVDTAGKLSGISGAGPFLEGEEGERSVVEGSISFGAGKAELDVTSYPNIEIEFTEF